MGKQEDIINGATEYATYIASRIPQHTQDKKLAYYFSGSLAMLLLSSAKKIAFVGADKDGNITFISPQQEISSESTNSFKKGVRPLSIDIDIVAIDDSVFTGKGKHYTITQIKENCHLSTKLCPAWSRIGGTAYFDILSDERLVLNHNIASLELENGQHILIVNPIDLILHKLSETLYLQTKPKQAEKYEKDVKDLACLTSGIVNLDIIPDNFEEYVAEVMKNNPTSSISRNLIHNHETEFQKLKTDLKAYSDTNIYEKVKKVMDTIEKFNKSISQNQPQ